jgi:CDGSH-type Zn-finger protein
MKPAKRIPVSVGLIEDPVEDCGGPIWLRAGISLTSADGYEYKVRNRMTVCRCGASKNKPFCDGSHVSIIQGEGELRLQLGTFIFAEHGEELDQ